MLLPSYFRFEMSINEYSEQKLFDLKNEIRFTEQVINMNEF